jgi:D-3-phosphoglycerate dehydrogenase
MAKYRLFAANYNINQIPVYEDLRQWLAERDVDLILAQVNREDEVIEQAKDADIYLAYKFKVTRNIIAALPRLKLLMASGSGYDHLDVETATEHGVIITNSATYNIEDVAEHALALILACGRKIQRADQAVRQGNWPANPHIKPVHRFIEQTVGIIGFGKIGQALAWRLKGVGFKVLAHDPYIPVHAIQEKNVEPAGLDDLLHRSDFISLHLRLNNETRCLLDEKQLRATKPTAFVINTSRGGVINEAALTKALAQNWIAGAGLDVLTKEPPAPDNPLLAMKNVILTGHSAGSSTEGNVDWQNERKRIIEDFLAGYWPMTVVNPEVQPKMRLKKRKTNS